MSGTTSDNDWQQVATSDSEWQRVTTSDTASDSEWEPVKKCGFRFQNEKKKTVWLLEVFIFSNM